VQLRDDVFPDEGGEPPPRSLAEQLARDRATQRPQRVKGLLIALAFAVAGIGVGIVGPVNAYRCTKEAAGTGRCVVERRPFGLFAMKRETLAGVVKADTETQDRPVRTGSVTLMGFVTRLSLFDAAGHTLGLTRWDETLDHRSNPKSDAIHGDEDSIRRSINDFLADPGSREASGWWAHSVPLIVGGVPIGIALFMLVLFVLSLFKAPTDAIYALTGLLAKWADAKKRAEWEERRKG
jgi:hypothetical protein